MKKNFIDFLLFLRENKALDNWLNAIEDQHAQDVTAFALKSTPAIFWINTILWGPTDEGHEYWKKLEYKWFEANGIDPENILDKIHEIPGEE